MEASMLGLPYHLVKKGTSENPKAVNLAPLDLHQFPFQS